MPLFFRYAIMPVARKVGLPMRVSIPAAFARRFARKPFRLRRLCPLGRSCSRRAPRLCCLCDRELLSRGAGLGARGAVSRAVSAARARRWWTPSHRRFHPRDSAAAAAEGVAHSPVSPKRDSPRTLARAFARPGEISTELREAISQSVSQIPSLVDTVLGPVTDAAVPRCPVLILLRH